MISARLGHALDKPLSVISGRIGVHPNVITVAGFIVTVAGAALIPVSLPVGGIVVAAGSLMDMLDGAVARANNKTSRFGAFLDSLLDRYSDAAIFIALARYFYVRGDTATSAACVFTMVGALLISYARARAEGVGKECRAGLMERPERLFLLVIGCTFDIIRPVVWALLALTHLTVAQRVWHVWKQCRDE
jgi:CDP-diacylglycerol--glycerol-3-phosphate 3-phosphatidyltransferase